MLSFDTAVILKKCGLKWQPALHDYFVIPQRGLEDKIFVISDMTVSVAIYSGFPVITFEGTSEWALDYVLIKDIVWLPREDQLRTALEVQVSASQVQQIELISKPPNYTCVVHKDNQILRYSATNASEAYAVALIDQLDCQKGKYAIPKG